MKTHYQVIVIGGGVVGCSVLYHLAKLGAKDVALLERRELTAGSSWHAAGGFHTINADPYIAELQAYTIGLYKELEEVSGQPVGAHRVGGINLASSPARRDYLKQTLSVAKTLGLELHALTMAEVKEMVPIMDTEGALFATYDPLDGYLDPSQTTHAYAKAARVKGAEIHTHTPVRGLTQRSDGSWDVITPRGDSPCRGGRQCRGPVGARGCALGRGLHAHPARWSTTISSRRRSPRSQPWSARSCMSWDFEGESYMRQEGQGLLLGTYEAEGVPLAAARDAR